MIPHYNIPIDLAVLNHIYYLIETQIVDILSIEITLDSVVI